MATPVSNKKPGRRGAIKCVVWDLDGTLWDGVLLEGDPVSERNGVTEIIKTIDARGILQSVASKNEHGEAMAKLEEFGLAEFFLHPQINWNSKASSIAEITRLLNIGIDSVAFIDDQPFELEEVRYSLPEVLCLNAGELDRLLDMPEMNPRLITKDSKNRRRMYISDLARRRAEEDFVGPKEEFLATLGMVFTISNAKEEDLRRAEELTVRTNQLNTSGYTYSHKELASFIRSDRYKLLMASLDDRFGTYSKVGLALIERSEKWWTIKLLLMSCRVMSRGVGSILLSFIMRMAKEEGVQLRAEFIPNGRNRMMHVTYKFAGFKEVEKIGDLTILENNLTRIQPFPEYVKVQTCV